jgi:hypothetical protein
MKYAGYFNWPAPGRNCRTDCPGPTDGAIGIGNYRIQPWSLAGHPVIDDTDCACRTSIGIYGQ